MSKLVLGRHLQVPVSAELSQLDMPNEVVHIEVKHPYSAAVGTPFSFSVTLTNQRHSSLVSSDLSLWRMPHRGNICCLRGISCASMKRIAGLLSCGFRIEQMNCEELWV